MCKTRKRPRESVRFMAGGEEDEDGKDEDDGMNDNVDSTTYVLFVVCLVPTYLILPVCGLSRVSMSPALVILPVVVPIFKKGCGSNS